jgi:hypothetical protein
MISYGRDRCDLGGRWPVGRRMGTFPQATRSEHRQIYPFTVGTGLLTPLRSVAPVSGRGRCCKTPASVSPVRATRTSSIASSDALFSGRPSAEECLPTLDNHPSARRPLTARTTDIDGYRLLTTSPRNALNDGSVVDDQQVTDRLSHVRQSAGLCGSCRHAVLRPTRRGTFYLRCALAATDARYPKYPRLPVIRCDGYLREQTTTA